MVCSSDLIRLAVNGINLCAVGKYQYVHYSVIRSIFDSGNSIVMLLSPSMAAVYD